MPPGSLLILNRGFYDFTKFAALVTQGSHGLTRLKNASYPVWETVTTTLNVLDQRIWLGHPRGKASCKQWSETWNVRSEALHPLAKRQRLAVFSQAEPSGASALI